MARCPSKEQGAGWGPWGEGPARRRRRPPWQSSRPGSACWRPLPPEVTALAGPSCRPALCRRHRSRPSPPHPPALSALGSEVPPAPPRRRRRRRRRRRALGRHSTSETFQRPRLSGTRLRRGGGGPGAARGCSGCRALLGRGTARARRRPAGGRFGAAAPPQVALFAARTAVTCQAFETPGLSMIVFQRRAMGSCRGKPGPQEPSHREGSNWPREWRLDVTEDRKQA
ncbi:uncharacterized protein AAG666_015944 [Megaptera novaeangliae]